MIWQPGLKATMETLASRGFCVLRRIVPRALVVALRDRARQASGVRVNLARHDVLCSQVYKVVVPLLQGHVVKLGQRETGILPWKDPFLFVGSGHPHGDSAESGWHRDVDVAYATQVFACILPLVPFTSINGATELVPASHTHGPPESPQAAIDAFVASSSIERAEMSPGDLLLLSGSLVHRRGRAASAMCRWSWIGSLEAVEPRLERLIGDRAWNS